MPTAASTIPTRYWHRLEDGRIQCDVCPRACKLREGQRGLCFVRGRDGDGIVLTTYGRSSGFCVDPIEKKPLNHFLPGTSVLSFGTAGCNLSCRFCQNWDISKSRELDTLADAASPETIAEAASALGCSSVAFTYNDPVVFLEYAVDVADACRERDIKAVAVTAGYVCAEPRVELFSHMDAANVDLKGFTEGFYADTCAGHLQPILETLAYLKHEADVWFEITNLLIPGLNDSSAEIDTMTRWIVETLGPDVPVHFTAFQDARPTADAARDAHAGALDRPRERRPSCLYRQRLRRGGPEHVLRRLRGAADRARLVQPGPVPAYERGPLRALRHAHAGRLRRGAGKLGRAEAAGPAGGPMRPSYVDLAESGELDRRAAEAHELLGERCVVCPRGCKVDRRADVKGLCAIGRHAVVASYFPHFGEEDCLRGRHGSGTIFFSGCNLRCVFCQNHDISWEVRGERVAPPRLASMMLELQAIGCHNINWVTPEHVVPQILEALPLAVEGGLRLPLVYNTSAYDSLESLRLLDGVVDVYMPDFKLWTSETARRYLKRADYPEVARESVAEMHRQVGDLVLDERGMARRGLILRHLIMPGLLEETEAILRFVAEKLGTGVYVNLMAQYYVSGRVSRDGEYAEIARGIDRGEYTRALELASELGLRLDPRSVHDGRALAAVAC
jgi:AmmeMemoRadiSam system radical SAM enzyme